MIKRATIDVHLRPTPNGLKIPIACEEMGLPYRIIPIDITKGAQFDPEFLVNSPNNKMPVIFDPAGPGGAPISIFESAAILQYLGHKSGLFYPGEESARIVVDQWLFWQIGGFGPMLGQNHHFRLQAPEKLSYAINRYLNETRRLYGVLDRQLTRQEFVAGAYSIADIALVDWASHWEQQGISIADYPHVGRRLSTVLARPAVKRGLQTLSAERATMSYTNSNAQFALFGGPP
jgi:GSH-dependent disulfide-bond oxidoreductase